MNVKASEIFDRNYSSPKRIVVNRGGTRSTKSYSICQILAIWLYTGDICGEFLPRGVASVVRKYRSTMDGTILRTFHDVLESMGISDVFKHDKTRKTFTYKTRILEFIGADDEQKVRGSERDILYCNEANELQYRQEFFQLLIRTKKKIFIDFNPDDEDIWINTEIEQKRQHDKKDVDVIVSNYTHNPFLSKEIIQEIEYLKDNDPMFWQIYGLGEYGKIFGLVFERETAPFPEESKLVAYGLDFGFTNDPTALVEVRRLGDDIYIKQLIYETRLTNQDISARLEELGILKHEEIIADSAEPKSIEELRRMGWNVKPALKGKDSIKSSIDVLRRYNLYVTPDSPEVDKEFRTYKWKQDKTGKALNEPVDFNNHGIDGVRYVALNKLKKGGGIILIR